MGKDSRSVTLSRLRRLFRLSVTLNPLPPYNPKSIKQASLLHKSTQRVEDDVDVRTRCLLVNPFL